MGSGFFLIKTPFRSAVLIANRGLPEWSGCQAQKAMDDALAGRQFAVCPHADENLRLWVKK
ncbi:TPA: hypothetical protein I8235_001487 [Kluyvera intermedia]|nr:hypothetical protein [Kluyvera intermedia]